MVFTASSNIISCYLDGLPQETNHSTQVGWSVADRLYCSYVTGQNNTVSVLSCHGQYDGRRLLISKGVRNGLDMCISGWM